VDGVFVTQSTVGAHAVRGIAPAGSVAITGIASNFIGDSGLFVTAGVTGIADTLFSSGVLGSNTEGYGVYGTATTGVAVRGQSFGAGPAGEFIGNLSVTGNASVGGNVTVAGTLSKGGGSFTIDHPLDPDNKYLQHSFVESPDMMNVYNGNATLDAGGEAWVALPEWFEALNRDFRYQLTPLGAPGPNLYVAAKVSGNRFRIAGGVPGGEVSWQVTGIRQDAWANANRIAVEKDKPVSERGTYLHGKELGRHGGQDPRD
jgi:hypothetical protein